MISTEIDTRPTVKIPVPLVRTPLIASPFTYMRLRRATWLCIVLACLGASWFACQSFLVPQPATFAPPWGGAQWIQAANTTGPVAYFRYATTLDSTPDGAFMVVAASQVFRLYVNGTFVGTNAQNFASGDTSRAYLFDVNSLLAAGSNVVALRVSNLDTHAPLVRAALGIVEGQTVVYYGTGNGWQATTQSTLVYAHTTAGTGTATIWTKPDFDPSAWQPAQTASNTTPEPVLAVNPALYMQPASIAWISAGSGHDGYFVRQFSAPLLYSGAWLRLAASGTADVFLNGHLLIHWNGQSTIPEQNIVDYLSDNEPNIQYRSGLAMGVYNIAPYIVAGVNTIAVHVSSAGTLAAQAGLPTLSAAMSADVMISDVRGNPTWLAAPAGWHVSPRFVAGWQSGSQAALSWSPALSIGRPGAVRSFYLQDSATPRNQQFLPLDLIVRDVSLSIVLVCALWLLAGLLFMRRFFASRRAALGAASLIFLPALALESVLMALSREPLIPQPFPYTWQWSLVLLVMTGAGILLVRRGAAKTTPGGTHPSPTLCRDRGWSGVDAGALCLSSSGCDSLASRSRDESDSDEGQAQGPRPSTSSTPCPYRIPEDALPILGVKVCRDVWVVVGRFLREHWMLIAIFLLALPLISYNLGYEPYWQDELTSYFAARGVLAHGLPVMPSGFLYPKGELYSYLLALSMLIFGDQGSAPRILSVLEYLASIPLFYAIARSFFQKRVALLATAMLAFSPMTLLWGREVRMYEQAQLCTLLVVYLFYRALDAQATLSPARRKRYIYLAMLSIVLSYLSHEETFIIFPALIGCAALAWYAQMKAAWRQPISKRSGIFHGMGKHCIIATALAGSMIGAQLLVVHFSHPPLLGTDQSQRPLISLTADNVMYYVYLLFFPTALGRSGMPLIMLNSCLALAGCILAIRQRSAFASYCAVFLGLSFLTLTCTFTLASDRYIYPVLPLYYLLGAYAFFQLVQQLRIFIYARFAAPQASMTTRAGRAPTMPARVMLACVAAPLCAATLILPALPVSNYNLAISRAAGLSYHRHYADYDAVGAYMRQHWQPGDTVITVSPAISILYYVGHIDYFFSLDRALYLFERNGHIIDTPTGSVALLDQQDFQAVIATHTRIWIISDNGLYQSETIKRFTFPPDFHIVYEGYGSAIYLRNG